MGEDSGGGDSREALDVSSAPGSGWGRGEEYEFWVGWWEVSMVEPWFLNE